MSHRPRYRRYQPRLYQRRMPIFWWVHRAAHIRFITRELTSVFVAFGALELLFLVRALGQGPAAYAAFLAWLQTPVALILNAVTVLMLLFHSLTWFNLAPRALVLHAGGRRIPDAAVRGLNYAAWVVVSAGLAGLLLAT
ncbi:hypothetical protein GQ464_014030 [Rhodocaloribacter litoris]|uniref:fumarate reductase subunit C n=1 Tax=Rhodocaloribacter litoris TaxID=2558931 RepID=UPI0014231882|nr:fumarate reductase subunit C [Rhodocaloribacter litoris]QXD14539.1 hypothetical protein GQ464_014030 [Rhodocaloribacter litoris]